MRIITKLTNGTTYSRHRMDLVVTTITLSNMIVSIAFSPEQETCTSALNVVLLFRRLTSVSVGVTSADMLPITTRQKAVRGKNARHAKEILEGKSALNDIWKQMRAKKYGSVVVSANCYTTHQQ